MRSVYSRGMQGFRTIAQKIAQEASCMSAMYKPYRRPFSICIKL